MTDLSGGLRRAGSFVLDSVRETVNKHSDDVAFDERIVGIKKATAAMIEAGVEDQRVIELLQKYWDLRLSEATEFVGDQKEENERSNR